MRVFARKRHLTIAFFLCDIEVINYSLHMLGLGHMFLKLAKIWWTLSEGHSWLSLKGVNIWVKITDGSAWFPHWWDLSSGR